MRVFSGSKTAVVLAVTAVAALVAPAHAIVSTTGWQNSPFQIQNGVFAVALDAVPSAAGMDGVIALSAAPATSYTGCAVLLRFNSSNTIDARNGAAYAAATSVAYAAGKKYHFQVTVNVPAHTYSVSVTLPNGTAKTLATNYAFRAEQATVTGLASWGLIADPGQITVTNVVVTGSGSPPALTANAGVDVTIAAGRSTVLGGSASGGTAPYTYAWTPATGLNNAAIAAPTASPSATTTYTLTVKDATGATAADSVVVTVTAAPPLVANAGADVAINAGGSTALYGSATGGTAPYTYAWTPTTGLSNAAIAAPTASPPATTTYTLTVKDASGKTATDSVVVTVSAPSGGQTSTPAWQNTPFAAQTGSFTADFDAVPNGVNIDAVTALSAAPISAYSSCAVLVRFNSAGTIDARNGANYAAYTSISYSAGTKYHFQVAVNVPAHTYSVYVTPAGGVQQTLASNYAFRSEQATASSLANWAIVADPGTHTLSNFTVTGAVQPPLAAEAGAAVTINAGASTVLYGSATGGTPPYTCSWSPATGLSNAAVYNPTATPTATTTYTLTATDAAGKTATDSVVVTVNSNTPPPLTANAGADVTITSGSSTVLYGSATGGTAPYTCSWSPATGLSNAAVYNPTATPTATTTYTLTATDAAGKTATDSVVVTVNTNTPPPLTAEAGADVSITTGSSAVLNGSATGGTAPYSYKWTPATGLNNAAVYNPTATPTATTTYTLTATDAAGKTATDSMVVTVSASTGGPTYYVSPSGNDSNAGSAAAPWKTIAKAASTLTAGSTVIVKAGTYNESLIPTRSGTAGNLITFKSETVRGAILDGNKSLAEGVDLMKTPASYIRVDGFDIRNFTDDGVTLNDWGSVLNAGIQIVNCYIHDVGQDAINFRNSKDSLIENCEIYNCGKTAIPIGGGTGSVNLVIRGCTIHHAYQDGIQGNSANSVIEYCNMYDSYWSDAHQDGFQLDAYTNITIRYNIVGDFTQLVYGGPASGDVGVCNGLYVYGNVFYDSQYWSTQSGTCPAVFIDSNTGASGSTVLHTEIYNNTFLYLGDTQKPIEMYGSSGTKMDDMRIYNNIFYGCRGSQGGNTYDIDTAFTNVKCDYNCYYNMLPMSGQDAHSITANPNFVNYTQDAFTFDVHVKAGSPVINAGAPNLTSLVTVPNPFLDIDHKTRPQGGNYDMGAYEQ